jgi:hypothetical protein
MLSADHADLPRRQQFDATHVIVCPLCGDPFDLLSAPWCGCDSGHPSKICPICDRCLCAHPDYHHRQLWTEPPAVLQRAGFQKLFLYYL